MKNMLLSTQTICFNQWVRKWLHLCALKFPHLDLGILYKRADRGRRFNLCLQLEFEIKSHLLCLEQFRGKLYSKFSFGIPRYIVVYTFGNLVLRRHMRRAVKRDFRTYIRRYTSPNEKFEHGYLHSNALLQFHLK